MKTQRCDRSWEASAFEDGRLDAPSFAAFERHAAGCSICQNEVGALAYLRGLDAKTEPARLSPLEHRRLRRRLLKVANAGTVEPSNGWRTPWALVVLACCLLVALGRLSRHLESPRASDAAPQYEVIPDADTDWRNETAGTFGRVSLRAGLLRIHVQHLHASQRFVVGLPDGELEVRGTRFTVDVSARRTTRVVVTEGTVVLRLRDREERGIHAGESWIADATVANVPRPPLPGDPIPALAQRLETGTADAGHALHRHKHARFAIAANGEAPPLSTDPQPFAPADPGSLGASEFLSAMSSFSSGAYVEADDRFAEFAARFPRDARVEDAAYLRVVIALRRGDHETAVVRARDYLNRFPQGLRRKELGRVVARATNP